MLRAARERRGLTLREVAETTKISPAVLTALEDNDIEHLPGGLFIRAFVRAYAGEVGLDPEETVEALLNAFPNQRPDTVVRPRDDLTPSERVASQPSVADTAIRLVIMSAIVVALLLFFGLRSSDDADDESGTVPVNAVTEPAEPSPGPRPDAQATSPLEGSPVVLAPPSPATEPAAVGPLTVAVHPTGPCWVSLTIDGERVFTGVLGAGEREVYEAEDQIILNVGDAGLFDFSINQQPGRSLGEPGQVVTVEIDRDNYRSFVTR